MSLTYSIVLHYICSDKLAYAVAVNEKLKSQRLEQRLISHICFTSIANGSNSKIQAAHNWGPQAGRTATVLKNVNHLAKG